LTAHTAYESDFTAGQGAAIHFRHTEHPGVWDWVSRFVEAEGFTGQIAFDFIETPDSSPYAIECNPRATSGVHLLAGVPGFARAFLNPDTPLITAAGASPAMLASAMLIYGLPAALRARQLHRWAAEMIQSKDVVLAWHDPLPVLLQGRSILRFLLDSWRQGISPLEASTADVEWNGEDILPVSDAGK
ncbi:MAG: carbamoylphosphate synthase large subunit, partial [Anaerolineae bacterium]|nr:carbamoylphosphate synthase large subunit [Anaerolineae bacterium]